MNSAQMIDRALESVADVFSREAAHKLIGLPSDPEFQRRMDELARKSNHGELSAEERDEFECCVGFVEMISVLQAKLRKKFDTSR